MTLLRQSENFTQAIQKKELSGEYMELLSEDGLTLVIIILSARMGSVILADLFIKQEHIVMDIILILSAFAFLVTRYLTQNNL